MDVLELINQKAPYKEKYEQLVNEYDDVPKEIIANKFAYNNDQFVKYVLMNNSSILKAFCQRALGNDLVIKETQIISSEIPASHKNDKHHFLDLLVIDEHGFRYNIEVQNYLTESDFIRFQTYAFKVITSDLRKGGSYNLKPMYQIIINSSNRDYKGLDQYDYVFGMYDTNRNLAHPDCLYYQVIVQLHRLDDNVDLLIPFNQLMYVFKNNQPNDIMKSKEVEELISMHDTYINTEAIVDAKILREEVFINTLKQNITTLSQERSILTEEMHSLTQEKDVLTDDLNRSKQEIQQLRSDIDNAKKDTVMEMYHQGMVKKEDVCKMLNLTLEEFTKFVNK